MRAGRPSSDIGFLPRINNIHPVGQNLLTESLQNRILTFERWGARPRTSIYEDRQVSDVRDDGLHFGSVVTG